MKNKSEEIKKLMNKKKDIYKEKKLNLIDN